MGKKAILWGLVLCVLLSAPLGRSLAQTRGPQSHEEFQRRAQELQRRIKQHQEEFMRGAEERRLKDEQRRQAMRKITAEYSHEAYREALGATAEQWKAIQPKLERVKAFQATPALDIQVYAFGASAGYEGGAFTKTSDGGRSDAHSSGRVSATGGSNSDSRSSMHAGTAGGWGQSSVGGHAEVRGSSPGPVKKQVGDMNLGWQWSRPSLNKAPDTLSESEKACEELLDVLDTDLLNPERMREQVETLRQVRQQRQIDLQQARRQLRQIVTPEQEAKLILMGYLD